MGRNDPESKWYSTPVAKRRAKPVQVTLTDAEREALATLAAEHGAPASRVVGAALTLLASSRSARRAIAEAVERVRNG
jgi:hypothetical protein